MKLLLKVAIRNKQHTFLVALTFINLILFTLANHAEMLALGLIANTGESMQMSRIEKTYGLEEQSPSFFRQIIDLFASKTGGENGFHTLVFLLVSVAFFKAMMLFSSRFTTQILSIRLTRDLRMQYFEHIQSLPFCFYQDFNVGALSARTVGDAGQIAGSINSCLTNYIQTPFTILSTLALCFYCSWQLSLVIFVVMPLIILPVVILTRKVKKVAREIQKNQETFTSVLLDFLTGIQTVKIFSMEPFAMKKYQEQNQHMAHLESKSAKYSLLTRPFLHTVTTTCLAVVALFGLHVLKMSIAEIIVFCGWLHMFYDPVKKFSEENANIQRGVIAAERMFEVLNKKPEIIDKKQAKDVTSFHKSLIFSDVFFRYKKQFVLKNISFSVQKGDIVAIVGPTGAGKSTIAHLIPRLYDVHQGKVALDGVNITEFTQKSLRKLIAFVPQKPFLFYDTVFNNIATGKNATLKEVEEAAKSAFAHDFIMQLPQNYHTVLSEMGKNLSGGEQQRIAIARALFRKSPILVLDEATSALDAISEEKIKQALVQLQGKVTQIIIAHRLSTIEQATKILYLENGEILAQGTKKSLLETCKPFQVMWETYHQTEARSSSNKSTKAVF